MTNKGTLINSKKGITVEVSTVKGIGKGAEKEFISILFSGKPSQNVLDSLKLKNFHYFKKDNTWSAYKTEYSEKFALSLIKENKEQEGVKTKKTEPTSKKSSGDKLDAILAKLESMDKRLTALENKSKRR